MSSLEVSGTHYMISSGHYLATAAGFSILQRGGNAIDAGVAAGLAINVVQPDMTNLGGVAPILVHQAASRRVYSISGVGWWPKAASAQGVARVGNGRIPVGVARAVVPAAVDAWLTALRLYGSLSLAEVAGPAIELAENGFPMYEAMRTDVAKMNDAWFDDLPSNREHYLPGGRLPALGERFTQPALARTLRRLIRAEEGARDRGREEGIQAARDRFYKGDIADEIGDFYSRHGGFLTRADIENFRVDVEAALRTRYRGRRIYTCGFWCQGPVLLEALNILEGFDMHALTPGGAESLHLIVEALKLAFSDRHAFYGDPSHVDVPSKVLLSREFASERRALIDQARAWAEMPPAGKVGVTRPDPADRTGEAAIALSSIPDPDTSYVCVVDAEGNAFSATPSDAPSTPVIPGLGIIASSRGYQSWLEPGHPSSIAPLKRPRLTPCPGMLLGEGEIMPFGTPGNDRQPQTMLQFIVNLLDNRMAPQQAVDAPRVASYSFPATGDPHRYEPGVLRVEASLPAEVQEALAAKGHRVQVSGGRSSDDAFRANSFEGFGLLCAVRADREKRTLVGAADRRRTACAMGW